jgi:hypothetical protein
MRSDDTEPVTVAGPLRDKYVLVREHLGSSVSTCWRSCSVAWNVTFLQRGGDFPVAQQRIVDALEHCRLWNDDFKSLVAESTCQGIGTIRSGTTARMLLCGK